jgi:hypothetical protein
MAMPVSAVRPIERREVELVDDVQDEPGEVAVGQPVAQVRRQQEGLLALCAQEVVGHGPFYASTVFVANVLFLTRPLRKGSDRQEGWV